MSKPLPKKEEDVLFFAAAAHMQNQERKNARVPVSPGCE